LIHFLSFRNDTDNYVKVIERKCEGDVKIALEREIPGISCTDGGFNRSMQHLI